MSRLKLILPNMEDKDEMMKYRKESMESNESMDGASRLNEAKSFEKWKTAIFANMKEETVREGFVPTTNYIAISIDDNRLVGMVNIRHYLNENLLYYGGHIGYSVLRAERHKGYASKILTLALKECKKLDIKKVLVVSEKDNIASVKTIIKNKGILEDKIIRGNEILERYWITLN